MLQVPLGTVLVSASFAIGSSLSQIVSSLIFVLVTRPYNVGDRITASGVFNGEETLIVKKVDVLTTTFLRVINKEVIIPNWSLAQMAIENFKRRVRAAVPEARWLSLRLSDHYCDSPPATHGLFSLPPRCRSPPAVMKIDVAVSMQTSAAQLEALRRQIDDYLQSQPLAWKPTCMVRCGGLRDQAILLSIWISSHYLWQDAPRLFRASFMFHMSLLGFMRDCGIAFRLADQSLKVHGTLNTRALPMRSETNGDADDDDDDDDDDGEEGDGVTAGHGDAAGETPLDGSRSAADGIRRRKCAAANGSNGSNSQHLRFRLRPAPDPSARRTPAPTESATAAPAVASDDVHTSGAAAQGLSRRDSGFSAAVASASASGVSTAPHTIHQTSVPLAAAAAATHSAIPAGAPFPPFPFPAGLGFPPFPLMPPFALPAAAAAGTTDSEQHVNNNNTMAATVPSNTRSSSYVSSAAVADVNSTAQALYTSEQLRQFQQMQAAFYASWIAAQQQQQQQQNAAHASMQPLAAAPEASAMAWVHERPCARS